MRKLLPGSVALIALGFCVPATAADLDVGAPTYKAALKTTDTMGHFGNAVITSTSNSTLEPGMTAGGGFEYAFTDNLSVKSSTSSSASNASTPPSPAALREIPTASWSATITATTSEGSA